MPKYKSVLEDDAPEYGSKAWRDMMEKKQALKTDTTLESLLATPVRGAMALAAPLRGRAALKSNTDIKNLIGRDVAKNAKQDELLAEIIKKTGRHPFKASPEVLKKEKNARILSRVKRQVGEDTAKSQLASVGFGADRAFNNEEYKKGGKVKKTAPKASSRADGIAQKGKTKGRII
jgi:hypothetical protein